MAVRSINIQINDVATPPPTISKEGNWLIYDGEKWVDTGVRAVGKDADPKALDEVKRGLANANNTIATLEKISEELQSGKLDASRFADIQYLLDAMGKGERIDVAGALMLLKAILMSNNDNEITTSISGYNEGKGNFIKAGIKSFGEASETSEVAINHDGTGHFGEVYFGGDRIDYKDTLNSTPYLSIGRMPVKRIESVINSNNVDTTQAITMQQLTLSASVSSNSAEDTKTIYVTNDNTAVTFSLDDLTLSSSAPISRPTREVEGAAMYFAAELVVDNTVICRLSGEWIAKYVGQYGSGGNGLVWVYGSDNTSSSQRKSSGSQSVTHTLNSGSHTVKFRLIKTFELLKYGYDVSASLSGCTVHQVYKTDYKQAIITPRGVRFYGGAGRYIDFDYYGSPALKMKGGFKADYIDTPGMPLCGAIVEKGGGVGESFGKYKNKSGESYPQVSYSYNSKRYTVYHSIPHDNYIPMLTVSQQNVARSISAINVRAYSFEVEVWTGFSLDQAGFNYVCFLADQPKS